MRLSDFLVSTAVLEGGPALSKSELVRLLLEQLSQDGHLAAGDLLSVLDAVLKRERLGSTGIGRGIAIPHAKHAAVPRHLGVLAVCRSPVEFDSIDGEPADIIVLLLAPSEMPGMYPGRPSRGTDSLFRRLTDDVVCRRLRLARSAEEITRVVFAWDEPV